MVTLAPLNVVNRSFNLASVFKLIELGRGVHVAAPVDAWETLVTEPDAVLEVVEVTRVVDVVGEEPVLGRH